MLRLSCIGRSVVRGRSRDGRYLGTGLNGGSEVGWGGCVVCYVVVVVFGVFVDLFKSRCVRKPMYSKVDAPRQRPVRVRDRRVTQPMSIKDLID